LHELFQEFMQQIRIRFLLQDNGRAAQVDLITARRVRRDGAGQVVEERSGLSNLFQRLGKLAGMVKDHVPHDLLDVPAGISVVADQGNAVGRQLLGAYVEDLILDRRRNPRIYAVTNNIIKSPEALVDVQDVQGLELDIG
jgi:hypothetical protein